MDGAPPGPVAAVGRVPVSGGGAAAGGRWEQDCGAAVGGTVLTVAAAAALQAPVLGSVVLPLAAWPSAAAGPVASCAASSGVAASEAWVLGAGASGCGTACCSSGTSSRVVLNGERDLAGRPSAGVGGRRGQGGLTTSAGRQEPGSFWPPPVSLWGSVGAGTPSSFSVKAVAGTHGAAPQLDAKASLAAATSHSASASCTRASSTIAPPLPLVGPYWTRTAGSSPPRTGTSATSGSGSSASAISWSCSTASCW
mmetsp:Transcript_78504/g.217045  ORF Transcript_78504/g.217045 Transcript_78504/m.217045 type:complete len:253 (-) Transcript_78504:90-848(-)